jgi:flagellar hook-associated protein 3 FlgL
MRVTSVTTYLTLKDGLGQSLARVQDQQQQLATGRRINRLSDAPSDAVTSLRYRAQESDWAAWTRSADDAARWATEADGTLQSATGMLRRVRDLAVQAVNGGLSPDARAAIGDEISQIRAGLVDLANVTSGGRALFAGFADTAVAQVAGTWSYVGDAGAVQRQIGPSVTVQVNLDGARVFGFMAGAGQDVFAVLDGLAAAARSGDSTGITAGQSLLDARYRDLTTALGQVGALQNRIDGQLQLGAETVDELRRQRGNVEDVDLAEAVLRLTQAQTGYQAALGAAGKAAQLPSLASFLR